MSKLYIAVSLLLICLASHAQEQTFVDDQHTERYQDMIKELRCLVCQNQNIADSNADLAKDLRTKTAELIREGQSDKQIREFMRERYGDFVLYQPPWSLGTALLWIAPILLVLIAIAGVLLRSRAPSNISQDSSSTDEQTRQHVKQLLAKQDNN